MPRSISPRLLAVIVIILTLGGCAAAPPEHLMASTDRFTPCSSAPHCVSSQAPADSSQHVEPFAFETSPAAAREALLATLAGESHATVVESKARFIHATFKSTLGFVDDVSFLIRPDDHIIDVKSSSRIGYYDFGVNRRRVARLRKAFEARLAQS